MPFVEHKLGRDFNTFEAPIRPEPEAPGIWDTFSSAFKMENTVMNVVDLASRPVFEPEEGFKVRPIIQEYDKENGTNFFDNYQDSFLGVQSQAEMLDTIQRIKEEEINRDTLSRAGWLGVVAGVGAGLVSPEVFLPFIGEARGLKALAQGAAIGLGTGAATEGVLAANQTTRTPGEVAIGIAASTALSGMLGGAIGMLRSGERELFEQELEAVVRRPQGVGADAVQSPSAGNLSSGAINLARANDKTGVFTNPVTQNITQTDFETWRTLMQQVSDSGLRMEGNDIGIAASRGGTIENNITPYFGKLGKMVNDFDSNYAKYFFDNNVPSFAPNVRANLGGTFNAGGKLSKSQFADEVTRALWNGGEHAIPEVAAAARSVDQNVYAPILKEAQAVGLMGDDIEVLGDKGYANRLYNIEAIQTKTAEFVNILQKNYEKQLSDRFAKDLEKFKVKQARKAELAEDLERPESQVDELVAKFKTQLDEVEETLPADIDAFEQAVKDKRDQARLMAKQPKSLANDHARKALLKDARDMEKANPRLGDFRQVRTELKRRLKNLTQSRANIEKRLQRKLDLWDASEDASVNALKRLVKSAQVTLRKLDDASDEVFDAEVSKLKDQFEKASKVYDKGEERLAKMLQDDPNLRNMLPEQAKPAAPERPTYVLDDVTARAHAREDVMPHVEEAVEGMKAKLLELGDANIPKPLLKKLNKALKTKEEGDWEAFSTALDLVDMNKGIKPEARNLLLDIDEMFNSPAVQSRLNERARFFKENFDKHVRAYDDVPLQTLESWKDAAKGTKRGDPWYRDPTDNKALDKAIAYKRQFEAANAPSGVNPEAHRLGALEDMQMTRAARLDEIAQRLDDAENIPREEVRGLIQEGLDESISKVAELNARRGMKQQKLLQEAKKLDPKKAMERAAELRKALPEAEGEFARKWEGLGAEGVETTTGIADFKSAARAAAEEVKDTIVGTYMRLPYSEILGKERGSELVRVLDIPSRDIETFLEKDIQKLAKTYVRTMAPDIEIARKFGGLDWREIIKPAVDELNMKIEAIDKEVAKEGADKAKFQKSKETRTRKLNADFDLYKRNFEAVIGRIRGTRGLPADPDGFAYRAARTVMNLNVLRMMGMVTISSFPDLARPMMRYGLMNTFKDGFGPLIKNLKTFKMNAEEARLSGAALDPVMHTRAMAVRDITDELQRGSKFEKSIEWATNKMGAVALFDHWTQANKLLVSSIVNAKLMGSLAAVNGDASSVSVKGATRFLAENGIDGNLAEDIWKQVTENAGGGKVDGVWYPNTESWKDPTLVQAYRQALAREINTTIIAPGVERPLLSDVNMLGRMLYQFKSFGMSSMPKMVMAGLQQRDAAMLSGSLASLGLGALSYYLWAVATGGRAYEDMLNADIGKWADEAISRSGLVATVGEVQRIGQNIPLISDYMSFSGKRQTRRPGDNLVEAILGPSFDFGENVLGVVGGIHDPTQATLNQFVKLLPYQNTLFLREAVEAVQNAIGANLPERRNQ